MIWWYKDIFISRTSNPIVDRHSVEPKNRTRKMTKIYTKLKSVVNGVIEYQRQKRLNQHSYRVLSQLDNHYLTDIGLINEDLHTLRSGQTPERFKSSQADQIKPAQVRLVCAKSDTDECVEDQLFEPAHLDKAA